MNKNDFVDRIAEKSGLSKVDANRALDAVTDVIAQAMKQGEEVVLVGFGSFKSRIRPKRTGRHPKTGAPLEIQASKTITFKTGKKLKDTVNS